MQDVCLLQHNNFRNSESNVRSVQQQEEEEEQFVLPSLTQTAMDWMPSPRTKYLSSSSSNTDRSKL